MATTADIAMEKIRNEIVGENRSMLSCFQQMAHHTKKFRIWLHAGLTYHGAENATRPPTQTKILRKQKINDY